MARGRSEVEEACLSVMCSRNWAHAAGGRILAADRRCAPAAAAGIEYSLGLPPVPPGYNRRKEGPLTCGSCTTIPTRFDAPSSSWLVSNENHVRRQRLLPGSDELTSCPRSP